MKAHAYDLARREGRLVSAEEASGNWYGTVYVPCVAAARRVDLQGRYADKTDTDIFLWVYGTLRQLRVSDPTAGIDQPRRSPGPLFADTNGGPVQLGTVRWGLGCAKKRCGRLRRGERQHDPELDHDDRRVLTSRRVRPVPRTGASDRARP